MKYIVGEPGGPAGPFYSVVRQDGRVAAMQIIDAQTAHDIAVLLAIKEQTPEGLFEGGLMGAMSLYLEIQPDLSRLIGLVQENQAFFGDPPAGQSCIKVAVDKLEMLVKNEVTPEQWAEAKTHFDCVFEAYKRLEGTPGVNVSFAIGLTFMPLDDRYESGERTRELYAAMLAVE